MRDIRRLRVSPDVGIGIAFCARVRIVLFVILFCLGIVRPLSADPVVDASIPFEYDEGLLWIKVQAKQSDHPLEFLFDTGASVSVINSDTAAVLELNRGKTIRVNGVNATTTGRWPIRLSAKAGKLRLPSKYLSLDLNRLALSCGRPLDGLLGSDFVQGRVVEINFQTHRLRFLSSAQTIKGDVILPLKRRNHCYVVSTTINNREHQWLRLDTGCASPLQWVTGTSEAPRQTAAPAIGLAGCLIPQSSMTVLLGRLQFDHIPTGIHHEAIFSGEAGLLGNGLLSRFKTVILDARSMHLVLRSRNRPCPNSEEVAYSATNCNAADCSF